MYPILMICLFLASGTSVTARSDAERAIELTQVDLFSRPDWEQSQVAVAGFFLGMTRTQAFEWAKANNLTLRSDVPPRRAQEVRVPCRQASCSLSQVGGNWIGVNLFFDTDRVTKIKVSVPLDADPDVKKVNIARTFKGLTHEFFNNYSESLRNRILGPAEAKETPVKVGDHVSALTYIEYNYPKLGVVVHTIVNKSDHPPRPFDLEVDFITARKEQAVHWGIHEVCQDSDLLDSISNVNG